MSIGLGFYLLGVIIVVLGSFQGKVTCAHILVGKRVCGIAVAKNKIQRMVNAHVFHGHICL